METVNAESDISIKIERKSKSVIEFILPLCKILHRLTPGEYRALQLIVNGKTFAVQAPDFKRSARTFSAQKRAAYRKIGINTDVEFIHYLYWLREVFSVSDSCLE